MKIGSDFMRLRGFFRISCYLREAASSGKCYFYFLKWHSLPAILYLCNRKKEAVPKLKKHL